MRSFCRISVSLARILKLALAQRDISQAGASGRSKAPGLAKLSNTGDAAACGIQGMRERARTFGGEVRFEQAKGGGPACS